MSDEVTDVAPGPIANFQSLTAGETETALVRLDNGSAVRVRGLTRYELLLSSQSERTNVDGEAWNLHTCLVEPQLTLGQATAWQKRSSAGGDIARVTIAIRDLSGLGEGADKRNL